MDLALALAIASFVIAVLGFAFGRKDKSTKDTGDYQYKMGVIDTKLDGISDKVQKVSDKLDRFDKDIDERIKEAIAQHEKIYHSQGEK